MSWKSPCWIVVMAAVICGVRCAGTPPGHVTGVMVPSQGGVGLGSHAPDVTFVDETGKECRLSSLYQDAMVIAFIREDCTTPSPELVRTGEALGRGVKIVEVFTGCRRPSAECVRELSGNTRSVIALCDGTEILARRYGVTGDDAVFVVDGAGIVVGSGTLADLPSLTRKAGSVAVAQADLRARLYGGN